MKKLLATLTALLVSFVALSEKAEAGIHLKIGSSHKYVSGHASCGCPIYTKRVVRGFNNYRRPIYNYYRQPFRCNCHSRRSSSYSRSFHHGGFSSRSFRSHSSRGHVSRGHVSRSRSVRGGG